MIRIDEITKYFSGVAVVSGLSLALSRSTTVALVGPSGCGKTTLLNLVAGLETPDAGRIELPTPEGERPAVAYMMQDPLLLPWRTLMGNALLGREVLDAASPAVRAKAERYFREFDILGSNDYTPAASSGGMKQKVALIRTLLCGGAVLLLDEPFTGLDFEMKITVQRSILQYQAEAGATILLVTHDIEDAIVMGDRVVVLSARPARIKEDIAVDLGLARKDPIEARKSPAFREYFARIWDRIRSGP